MLPITILSDRCQVASWEFWHCDPRQDRVVHNVPLLAPRGAIGPYWPKKGAIGGPLGPQNSKEKWTLMILVRHSVKLNFNQCFLDIFDLADILGITVWFLRFLIFDHVWPSRSPESQHFFFSGAIFANLAKGSLNYPAYSLSHPE